MFLLLSPRRGRGERRRWVIGRVLAHIAERVRQRCTRPGIPLKDDEDYTGTTGPDLPVLLYGPCPSRLSRSIHSWRYQPARIRLFPTRLEPVYPRSKANRKKNSQLLHHFRYVLLPPITHPLILCLLAVNTFEDSSEKTRS